MSEVLTKGQRATAWLISVMSGVAGAGAVFVAGILWLGDIKSAAADAKAMGDRNEKAMNDVKGDIHQGFKTLADKIQVQGDQVIMLAGKLGAQDGRTAAIENAVNAEIRPQLTQIRESAAKVSSDVSHVLESQREVRSAIDRLLERLDRPR